LPGEFRFAGRIRIVGRTHHEKAFVKPEGLQTCPVTQTIDLRAEVEQFRDGGVLQARPQPCAVFAQGVIIVGK